MATVLSPPVRLHQLLTAFQTDWPSLLADALCLALLVWYLAEAARASSGEGRWPGERTACFFAGLVTLFVATGSGLASYGNSVFVVHVVQYLLLMYLAPVLLALGTPAALVLAGASPSSKAAVTKLLGSKAVRVVTFPVATAALAYVTLLVYFLTPLYDLSVHPAASHYFQLYFLLAGCLYWWPVVGLDPVRWQMSYPIRLAYLAAGVPVNAMIGVALTMNRASIDPSVHTVADTHLGGAVLWGMSELLLLAGIAAMYVSWARWDAREAAHNDHNLDRELAEDRERGLAGGIIMDPRTGLWHYPGDPGSSRGPSG